MTVLIIQDISIFPVLCSDGGVWQPINNTVSGDYWLQLESKKDLDNAGINYEIGEVEIKQDEI